MSTTERQAPESITLAQLDARVHNGWAQNNRAHNGWAQNNRAHNGHAIIGHAINARAFNGRAHDDLAILITRRKPAAVLGGFWELPGGKVEPGESHAQCLVRELIEEVGIEVQPLASLDAIEHRYEHAHVRLLPFLCRRVRGLPEAFQVDAVRWVLPGALSSYTFPPANAPLIAALARALGRDATEPVARALSLQPLAAT